MRLILWSAEACGNCVALTHIRTILRGPIISIATHRATVGFPPSSHAACLLRQVRDGHGLQTGSADRLQERCGVRGDHPMVSKSRTATGGVTSDPVPRG
jgi:hypothetical protein